MIYILRDIPTMYFEGIEELATDTIEDDVWEVYCQDRSAWKVENGKFVRIKPPEEVRAAALNGKYIPDERESAAALLRTFLKTNPPQDTETKLAVSGLYAAWTAGKYEVGDIRNHAGQTWECLQSHDNAEYPDIVPENAQTWHTFWKPLHGKSAATARPWVKPQFGTTDMYLTGEYMVYTDGKTYKCLSDTVYSPEEYAKAWEAC